MPASTFEKGLISMYSWRARIGVIAPMDDQVEYAFNKYGHGAIINSSRGIMCAWQKTGKDGADYQEAARDAALAMRDDIRRFVTIV